MELNHTRMTIVHGCFFGNNPFTVVAHMERPVELFLEDTVPAEKV